MIVIIVIGWSGLREIGEERRIRRESGLASLSAGHSNWNLICLTIQHLMDKREKGLLPLPDHDVIDKGEGPQILEPHFTIEIGPAKDDGNIRMDVLDQLGHCQARNVLVERRGKADQFVLPPINRP